MPKREDKDLDSSPPLKPIEKNIFNLSSSEKLWKLFTAFTVPLSFILLKQIIEFQNWAQQNLAQSTDPTDLWLAICAFVVIYFVRKLFQRVLFAPVYKIIEDKHQGEERIERTKRVVKWMYDVLYYGSLTYFVFGFFGDAYFIPPSLLGTGQCDKLFLNYPELPKVRYLKQYYLIQLGSHFCSVFEQLMFKLKDIKFYEYFLHHYLAFVLIFFSYMTHKWELGAMVLITHDISDIFLAFARALEGQRYLKSNKLVVYAILGVTAFMWGYCRTYVFPACAIYTCFNVWGTLKGWEVIKYPYMFEFSLLCVLLIMNFYWVFILSKMFVNALISKGLKNDYDPSLLKLKKK